MGIKRFPIKVFFIDQLKELVSPKKDKTQRVAMNHLQLLARQLENNAAQLLPRAPEVSPFTEDVCTDLIISQLSPGEAVLIFHSGLGDINEFCNNLHDKLRRLEVRHRYSLFILHSQVQREDQDEAFFEPLEGKANIIVANRGSESSLTIPNLRLVINFGINKEMMYNSAKRISELSRQWCSRASCIQREGRVGRVCEGTAVHLFTKEFYETLPDFGPPEIIRVPLAKTFLRAKQIGPKLGIPFPSRLLSMVIEPPSFVHFSTALHDLAVYGAIAHNPQQKISEEADVTLLGTFSLSLPLDLNLCRLVLLGILFGCPLDGIVIAAATAMYQDVFSMPMKIIMNDLHQFCHSLNTSTFSRMKYDDGCYSNPIMVLNMFIDWLQYKSRYPECSRRDLAFTFGSYNAIKFVRLLHFEEFVGDIARCVANCIPHDTALYSELQTLSHISMERKGFPVFCESDSFFHKASQSPPSCEQDGSTGLLHFCNNCVILKALIAAAAPDDILCGERACESSSPYSKTFAQKCINVIKEESFSLSHTLCMDVSKLDVDEAALEELFENLPSDFDLSVKTKVVRDVAVLHFRPDPSSVLTKTAKLLPPSKRKYSTAEISQISPEMNFFWRFGEQNLQWKIDEVDILFPAPSHPCALMWYRFDESKSKVNTVKLNFRNPTGFICQYDKPSQPYFAVATGAFASSGGSIVAPRLTVLPNMPTSLMMVLAFQLSTSAIEFLINKKDKTIEAIKINLVKIPCTDIEKYISSDEISAINQVRKALSNVMALPLNNGCLPLYNPEITRIPELLHDLLKSCKPSISKSTTSNLQTLSMDDRPQGLVWEMVTPGDQCTSHYAEFKCSLLGSKPYAVKEVYHDRKLPLCTLFTEYTQSVSAKLLAESKKIHKQGRVGALDDLCTVSESLNVCKKKRVEADLGEKDKQRTKNKGKCVRKDLSTVSESLKVCKKMKKRVEADLREKDKQRTKNKGKCARKDLSTVSESSKVHKKVKKRVEADLREKDKQRTKNKGKCARKDLSTVSESSKVHKKVKKRVEADFREKDKQRTMKKGKIGTKERKRAKKEATILFSFPFSPLFPALTKEKVNRGEERKRESMKKREMKERKRTQRGTISFSPPPFLSLFYYPSSSLLEADLDEMMESMEETYLREEDKIREKIIRKREKKEKRKAEKKIVRTEKGKMSFCSSPPSLLPLPFWPVGDQMIPHGQEWIVLSKNCPKIRQKQNPDAKIATTSKQKLPTQSDDAGLQNPEGGLTKSMSQIVPNNGNGKQTVSKYLTTATNFGEKRKPCLTTVLSNSSVHNKHKKTDSVTQAKIEMSINGSTGSMAETANRCQSQYLQVSHTQKPLKELAISDGSFMQKAASVLALSKISSQHSTGEHMAQFHDGFISECGGQTRLRKEASLKETEKMHGERETTLRVVKEKEMLKERDKIESFFSEESIGREKIQKQSEATLSKVRVEQAVIKEEEKSEAPISEEGVESEKEGALRGKEEERKATPSEEKRVKRNTKRDKDVDQKERKVDLWENEKVEREKQATLKGNGTVKAGLMQDNTKRKMPNRKSSDKEKERGKKQLGLGTTNLEQESPAQSGIAGPEPSKQNEISPALSVSKFLPANSKHQAAIKGIKPLEDEGSKSLTTLCNPNVSDENKIAGTETQIKNENGSTKSMTTTASRCQSEVEVLKVSRTKEPLKETAVSGISSTKHKAASERSKEREAALNVKERVEAEKEASVKVKEKEKVERRKEEKDKVQKVREVSSCKNMREEREKETAIREKKTVKREQKAGIGEEDQQREKRKANKKDKNEEATLAATTSEQEPSTQTLTAGPETLEGGSVVLVSQIVPTNGNGKQAFCKSVAASMGTQLSECQEKRSLIIGIGNVSVPDERKKTFPETQMQGNSITESVAVTASRCQSEVEVLEVSHTKKPLIETVVSFTMHTLASEIPPNIITAQPDASEQFPIGFINECGGQTRPATLMKEAPLKEKDKMQEEKETALTEIEKVEIKKKEATLKGNGKLNTEEEDLIEEDMKSKNQGRRETAKVKENEKKEVVSAATNSEQEPQAHLGIAEPERRLIVSVSQIVPTNGNSKLTASDPLTAPNGTHLCKHQEKNSCATATSNCNIPDESKKTVSETKIKTEISEKGNTEAVTESANRCQSEVEVLKVSQRMNSLRETPVSDISSTKKKSTSQNKLSAKLGTCEHIAQFPVGSIIECGGQTKLATLREEAPLKEKGRVHKEREAALNEKDKVEPKKEASVKVKEKERVEKRKEEKDKVQKEREEVVLCEKVRVEGEKTTVLKDYNKKVSREQEDRIGKQDQQWEKRKAKRNKKEKNEREKKEAALAATTSEQEASTQIGTAGPKTSEGGSVVLASQIVPTNGKQAVSKPIAASMCTQLSEFQEKRSLSTGTDNTSVLDSMTGSMTVTANRCQSEVEVLKVSVTKERLKEMSVSDISSTKHTPASEIASNTAQHSTGEHMAACLVGFINECGGQTRPATLMEDTHPKEKDKMQEEKETALPEKERIEIKKKEATLKGNGKLKTKEEDLIEDKREKQRKRKNKKVKGAALAATNLEQEPPAHSSITEPKGRLVVSVSQTVPTNGNSMQTTSDPLTAPNGTNLCKHQEKRSCAIATGNCTIPDESKKTGPETQMRTEISEKGSTEAVTESANGCQFEVEVLKVSHRTNPLKKVAVSDIFSTMQKATSKVVPNKLSAKHGTCEHIAQFPVGSIIECGGQTKLATLREGTPLREKGRACKEREAALNEKEREEAKKEASVKVKEKERVERRKEEKDKVQKEREELVLCEKVRVEGEKTTALKDYKNGKKEQKAGIEEKDQQREKRMASKREKNEREKKEATLAATTSEQEPSTQTLTAGPEASEGGSVVLVSQIVPTNGNDKQAVCNPVAASMGTQLSEKWSLITGKDNTTVPVERKNTIPKTQILENVSANSGQSVVDVLKVTHTKKPLKETVVSDRSSTKRKTASKVASQRIPAQPGTGEHMAQFLVDFINECGGQTRLATLKKEAFQQYQEKFCGQYTYLSKAFLRQYDCFEIFDDSSGVCHVRIVGGERRSLANTKSEKMEHKTKKILFYKPVCNIKVRYSSKDKVVSESDFASFPGSPEHIVEYLHHYLSSHFFPYGCPVSSLDELYQKEYRPRCSHPAVPMINANFLKEFSNYFVLQVGRTFVKLKEGVDYSDTSQLKGCPYTPQHVNDYFRRYLAKEGVVCTQHLRVLFSVCYMKEFKMPQNPIIQFIQDDFFKQSRHLFVTFADIVVFRK